MPFDEAMHAGSLEALRVARPEAVASSDSEDLVVPANVSLIGLLPYSPELNPVENLWHYLRSHYWSHGVYPDYDTLMEVATETWRTVCLDSEKIRSICAAPYLEKRKSLF